MVKYAYNDNSILKWFLGLDNAKFKINYNNNNNNNANSKKHYFARKLCRTLRFLSHQSNYVNFIFIQILPPFHCQTLRETVRRMWDLMRWKQFISTSREKRKYQHKTDATEVR